MHPRALSAALLAAASLLATASAAGAGAGAPDESRLAREQLLTRGDLGRTWTVTAQAPARVPTLTCPAFDPHGGVPSPTAAATSPTFSGAASGPFASQSVYLYAGPAQERLAWDALTGRSLLRCVAATLTGGSTSAVAFTVRSKSLFTVRRLPARARGFEVAGTATSNEVPTSVYLDAVVLGHDRTLSEISVSSFDRRQARREALRLARIAAKRIVAG